jgi:hypothetical protein
MIIAPDTLSLLDDAHTNWRADWAWGCTLIVLTVIIHVFGLGLITEKAILFNGKLAKYRPKRVIFALVVGTVALLATMLHAFETFLWAISYIFIGARPDLKTAMLYSLGAMTTYGHSDLFLEEKWRMAGPIESLNGILLFGLSTAFLFWLIQEVSPRNRTGHRTSSSQP